MKVLQINITVNSGSTGRIAEDIGSVLIDSGYKSLIGFGRGNQQSKSETIRIGGKWDIWMHGMQTILFDRHGLASKAATKDFLKIVRQWSPDIIHLHNIHGYYLNYPILIKYLLEIKIPVVWTLHDCWTFTGHCVHYENIGCYKWETKCFRCPKKTKYPSAYLLDNSEYNYNYKKDLFNQLEDVTFVVPSHWLKDELGRSFLSNFPSIVIHNGIDLNIFKPDLSSTITQGFVNKKIILGVASVWQKSKGWYDFIELAKYVDSDNYQIVLIGVSEKQKMELPSNIHGILKTESVIELAAWYSRSIVFVNPTYLDTFPTTNLESLACGTPVITYNTGGSPECLDQETGYVLEKGDVKGIWEFVQIISKFGKQYYSAVCRDKAILKFNKDDRYSDYLNLYSKILGKNS